MNLLYNCVIVILQSSHLMNIIALLPFTIHDTFHNFIMSALFFLYYRFTAVVGLLADDVTHYKRSTEDFKVGFKIYFLYNNN